MNNSKRIETLEKDLHQTRQQLEAVANRLLVLEAMHISEFDRQRREAIEAERQRKEKP